MTTPATDPALDLTLERLIRAPRQAVWRAWTDPALVEQWWIPAPAIARVDRLDARPGGPFVTSMSEDNGVFLPHTDNVFLVVEDERMLVFTNAIDSNWRPSRPEPVPMTAQIVFEDHPYGTNYRVVVRHGNPADRNHHKELGFYDGWGAVTEALAAVVEAGTSS